MRKLLIAIPAYNEEPTVASVVSGLPRAMDGVDRIDVLVVDDGSTDRTADAASRAGARVLSHGRNLGLGAAFRSSLGYARENGYRWMVTLDADGQFSPASVPRVAAAVLEDRADLATASRFADPGLIPRGISRIKLWGNRRVARLVSVLSGVAVADATCGFRAYGPRALEMLSSFSRFTYTQEVIIDLASKGMRIREVPVEVLAERPAGDSRISGNLWRYAALSLAAMYSVSHDHRPWRFYGIPALAMMTLGTVAEVFVFVRWLAVGMVTPYKGVAIAGLFLVTFGAIFGLFASLADTSSHNRRLSESILADRVRRRREEMEAGADG
jgi:glycosyltransferase involved in cell wall biosynthesis